MTPWLQYAKQRLCVQTTFNLCVLPSEKRGRKRCFWSSTISYFLGVCLFCARHMKGITMQNVHKRTRKIFRLHWLICMCSHLGKKRRSMQNTLQSPVKEAQSRVALAELFQPSTRVPPGSGMLIPGVPGCCPPTSTANSCCLSAWSSQYNAWNWSQTLPKTSLYVLVKGRDVKEEISSSRLKSWEAAMSDQEVTTMNSLSHLRYQTKSGV